MNQKAIIFTEKNKAELIEQPIQKPSVNEVLVKLMVSTISGGTERANITGEKNISIATDYVPEVRFPRYAGYSSSGIVEEVGENVTTLKKGDRVAVSWSSHRQYIVANVKNVYKLNDNISFNEAALWHIATFPLLAVRKCALEIGECAMVTGLGILGLMAVKLLKTAGASPIIAVDPVEKKRNIALEMGADFAFDPTDKNFLEDFMKASNGGANVAIEVTGNGNGLNTTLDCMKKFGRVALLGCTRQSDFNVDYYKKVHGPGVSLIGCHTLSRPTDESAPRMWTTRDDVFAIQKLVTFSRINFESLVEEIHSPSDAPQVYSRLISDKMFPITQFDWSKI